MPQNIAQRVTDALLAYSTEPCSHLVAKPALDELLGELVTAVAELDTELAQVSQKLKHQQ